MDVLVSTLKTISETVKMCSNEPNLIMTGYGN